MTRSGKTYDAFISYKRLPDEALATAVQTGLHSLARRWLQWRALRVFRDITSLPAGPDLGEALRERLRQSEYLILIASPEAFVREVETEPTWVEQELHYWLSNCGGPKRLLIAQSAGEIYWDRAAGDLDWSRTTALPPSLRGLLKTEPTRIDLRWARPQAADHRRTLRDSAFANAVAALAEPIHGRSRELLFSEDAREQRKAARFRNLSIFGLIALGIGAVVFWRLAVRDSRLADSRAQMNLSQRLAAQSAEARLEFPQASALLAIEALEVARTAGLEVGSAENAARRSLDAFAGSRPLRHEGLRTIATHGGKWLATGGEDQLIQLWRTDLPDPRPRVLPGHHGEIRTLAFSPDGKWLVSTSSQDHRALLWMVESPFPEPQELPGEGDAVGVAFSWFGDMLGVLYSDRHVLVWRVGAGGVVGAPITVGAPDLEAKTLAFSSDDQWLAIGYRDRTARLWRRATLAHQPEAVALAGHDDDVVRTLTFSPDGRWLVTTSADQGSDRGDPPISSRTARLWKLPAIENRQTPILLQVHETYHRIHDVRFSDDSQWLMMRAETPDLRLWHLTEEAPLSFTLLPRVADKFDELSAAVFSHDSHRIATGSRRGSVRIWDLSSASPFESRELAGVQTQVNAAVFDDRDTMLFAADQDGVVRAWDLAADVARPAAILAGHEGGIGEMILEPGGRHLLTASFADHRVGFIGDESVRRYPLSNALELLAHGYGLQTSPDRRWLAFSTGYRETSLIATAAATVTVIPGETTYHAFSPRSGWLATRDDTTAVLTRLEQRPTSVRLGAKSIDVLIGNGESIVMVVASHDVAAYGLPVVGAPSLLGSLPVPNGYESFAAGTYASSAGSEAASSFGISDDEAWFVGVWWKRSESGGGSEVRLWSLRSSPVDAFTLEVPEAHSGMIVGHQVIVTTRDGSAYLWSLPYQRGDRPRILPGGGPPSPSADAAQHSSDDRWLVTFSQSRAFVWDLSSGQSKPATTLGPFAANALGGSYSAWRSAVFSEDGRWLAVVQKQDAEPHHRIWLVKLGSRPEARPLLAAHSVNTVVFSSDGNWLAATFGDDLSRVSEHTTISLWKLDAWAWGELSLSLAGHNTNVDQIAFVDHDRYLVSVAIDRSVVKWDLSAVDPRRASTVLQGPSKVEFLSKAYAVQSADASTLTIMTERGNTSRKRTTVESIPLDAGDLIAPLCRAAGRTLRDDEKQHYSTVGAERICAGL